MSYVNEEDVINWGVTVTPNGQYALLADNKTRMRSKGEVDILVTAKANICLRLRALVVSDIDCNYQSSPATSIVQ